MTNTINNKSEALHYAITQEYINVESGKQYIKCAICDINTTGIYLDRSEKKVIVFASDFFQNYTNDRGFIVPTTRTIDCFGKDIETNEKIYNGDYAVFAPKKNCY